MPTVHTSTPVTHAETATQALPHPPSYAHTCAHTRMCQRARRAETNISSVRFVLLYTAALSLSCLPLSCSLITCARAAAACNVRNLGHRCDVNLYPLWVTVFVGTLTRAASLPPSRRPGLTLTLAVAVPSHRLAAHRRPCATSRAQARKAQWPSLRSLSHQQGPPRAMALGAHAREVAQGRRCACETVRGDGHGQGEGEGQGGARVAVMAAAE